MKAKFSKSWVRSTQQRKQRKYRYNAPLHRRQKMVAAHLSAVLRKQYSRRAMPLRKGDEVKVMRGAFRKRRGKVEKIDLKKMKAAVEGIKRKRASGEEVLAWLEPSNLMLTQLSTDDKRRMKFAKRKEEKTGQIS